MSFAVTAGSFAAAAILTLFWCTVLSRLRSGALVLGLIVV